VRRETAKAIVITLAVLAITAGHYVTSLHLRYAHDIYLRLYYLPIIFAGFSFGLRGGVLTAAAVSALLTPHVLFQWHDTPLTNADQYLEMLVYVAVGGVTGALSQKEAQRREELRIANSKIEDGYAQLRQQSRALVEADEQLRRAERLAVIGELSAGMAHEIRNPLGSIKGAAEIFRDTLGPNHPLEEFARILVVEADRLDAYLTEFLGFARPTHPVHGGCDVRAAVEHVAQLTRERSRRMDVRLATEVPPEVPPAAIPPDALRQVLLNLVLNATQALSGAGRVTVRAAAVPHGSGDGSSGRRTVRITVEDDGPGIAPDVRDRIFEPFFTTKAGGTGLGLAICQRLVVGYRGAICADDVSPHGTRFTVDLPSMLEVSS
jgi:two-component system, NtrC family, sensor histidine kinase HydH